MNLRQFNSAVIAASVMALALSAAAAEPVAVAVLNFANQAQGPEGSEWNWLEKGLADLVINDLSTQNGLLLVDRDSMQEVLTAEGILVKPDMDLQKLTQVFVRKFKVARVVFGSFAIKGNKISITASIIDAYSGKLIQRLSVEGKANDVLKVQKQLSGKIIARLLNKQDGEKIAAALPVWTESLPASKLLYEAMDKFDHGEFSEAWLYARRARRVDPKYPDALYWVGRMHYYMLQYPHARRYFEEFVYKHTGHPRSGDAVIEYLDTYERATTDTPAKIREITSVLRVAPHALVRYVSIYGVHVRPIADYLNIRLAAHLLSTTEYASAARALELVEEWSDYEVTLYDQVRMQAGVVLAQPGSLEVPKGKRALSDWGTRAEPRVHLLRPGVNTIDVARTSTGDDYDTVNELLFIPANHQLREVTATGKYAAPSDNYKCKLLLCLESCRGGEQYSNAVDITTKWQDCSWHLAPISRGRLYRVLLVGWCVDQHGNITNRARLDKFPSRGLNLQVTVDPATDYGHMYLDRGFLGGFAHGWTHLDGRGFCFGRGQKWATYMPCKAYKGQFYEFKEHPVPQAKCSMEFETPVPQNHTLTVAHVLPASGGLPSWPADAKIRRIAHIPMENSHSLPTIAVGEDETCCAVWEANRDLWMATSTDGGRNWGPASLLPVPVNSAHGEGGPDLAVLDDGRYVLCFGSDRGVPRKSRSYITTSYDLKRWTAPSVLPIPYVDYIAKDTNGGFIAVGTSQTRTGHRPKRMPFVWVLRSDDCRHFEVTPVEIGELQDHSATSAVAVWSEEDNGKIHCIVSHNVSSVDQDWSEFDQWNYKLCEYVGTGGDKLELAMRCEGSRFGYLPSGYISNGKLVVLYSHNSHAYVFDSKSIDSGYRVFPMYLNCWFCCYLKSVTPDGRMLCGMTQNTPGDEVYLFERDIAKGLEGSNVCPANVTRFSPDAHAERDKKDTGTETGNNVLRVNR